jgi:hypothetical protein
MIPLVLTLLLMQSQASSHDIGADQFLNVMHSLQADVHDVAFIYEGEEQLVAPGATKEDQESFRKRFQGSYAYRSDGATYLDLYISATQEPQLYRSMAAVFRDKTELLAFAPSQRSRRFVVERKRNHYLLERTSPQRFFFYWFFQSVNNASSLGYECQGWEVMNGRNCLKVRLRMYPDADIKIDAKGHRATPDYLMWIDLERGGHPVRVDTMRWPPDVSERTQTEVQQFTLPGGKKAWFPISAVTESFLVKPGQYSKEPLIREIYAVVRRTVRFNGGIPDSTFTVRRDDQIPGAAEIDLRKAFKQAEAHPPSAPRNDPKSVTEMLEQKLVEADRQSKMLEASSPARDSWSWSSLAQFVFLGAGMALLASIFWWRQVRR